MLRKLTLGFAALTAVFFLNTAHAADFTLTNNQSGERFTCSPGGGGGGGTAPEGCVARVSEHCYKVTSHSRDVCFNRAMAECRSASYQFGDCVVSTEDYCYKNTSHSHNVCFDKAIETCKGSPAAMIDLFQDVKAQAQSGSKIDKAER